MKTILIVEDDQFLRDLSAKKLEQAGFNILTASSAEKAMQALDNETIDLLILDLELPGRSGLDYLKDLKQAPQTQSLPVIIFSNLDDPEMSKNCLVAGASAYFIKVQTDYSALIHKINELLS